MGGAVEVAADQAGPGGGLDGAVGPLVAPVGLDAVDRGVVDHQVVVVQADHRRVGLDVAGPVGGVVAADYVGVDHGVLAVDAGGDVDVLARSPGRRDRLGDGLHGLGHGAGVVVVAVPRDEDAVLVRAGQVAVDTVVVQAVVGQLDPVGHYQVALIVAVGAAGGAGVAVAVEVGAAGHAGLDVFEVGLVVAVVVDAVDAVLRGVGADVGVLVVAVAVAADVEAVEVVVVGIGVVGGRRVAVVVYLVALDLFDGRVDLGVGVVTIRPPARHVDVVVVVGVVGAVQGAFGLLFEIGQPVAIVVDSVVAVVGREGFLHLGIHLRVGVVAVQIGVLAVLVEVVV